MSAVAGVTPERRGMSLSVRLASLTCAALLVVLGIGYLIQYRLTSVSMENLASDGALSIFNSVHSSMTDSLEKGKMELFQQSLDQAGQGSDVLGLWLLSADGAAAYASSGSSEQAALPPGEVGRIAESGAAVVQRDGAVLDVYQADLVTPDCQRCHSSWKVGDVGAVLHLRYSLSYLEAANRQTALTSVAAFVATAGILLAVIVISLSRFVLRPVKRLAAGARAVAMGNLDTDIRQDRNDEIGELAASFAEVVSYQREMAVLAEGIAAGELYREVRARSSGDRLGHALTRMVSSLRQAVRQVIDGASEATAAAGEASRASAQTGQATGHVAETTEDVAEGANRAAQAVTEANRGMRELSGAIDGIARGAHEAAAAVSSMVTSAGAVAREAEQVKGGAGGALSEAEAGREAASRGTEAVNATLREMDAIRQVVAEATTKVTEMGQRSQEVSHIVRTIEEIAAQTNLLALNAQIEAARAGQQGLGFAVVADEVRKLAERSARATQEIAVLVAAVQQGADEAVDAIDRGGREVASGVELAREAGAVIEHLQQTVQRIAVQAQGVADSGTGLLEASRKMVAEVDVVSAVVEQVSASTEEMAASSAQVADALGSVAGVAKAVGASAEEVASSTLKVAAQAEQVKALAQSVADGAASVLDAVSFFDLGGQPEGAPVPAPAVVSHSGNGHR